VSTSVRTSPSRSPLPTVRLYYSHPTYVLQCHLERRRGDGVARQQQDGQIHDAALIGTISMY